VIRDDDDDDKYITVIISFRFTNDPMSSKHIDRQTVWHLTMTVQWWQCCITYFSCRPHNTTLKSPWPRPKQTAIIINN